MTERSISELRSMIGTSARIAAELRIEAGKVAEFANAIGDPSPIYRDRERARTAGFDEIPAPLTFTRTVDFPRYRTDAFSGLYGLDLGLDPTTTLHGEQRYEYHRPAVVGDVLSVTSTLRDVRHRTGGRGGEMTLVDVERVFEDEADRPVVTATSTYVELESGDGMGGSGESTGETDRIEPDPREEPLSLVAVDLDRTDFVRYAGASGDFTPLHFDEPHARSSGFETVFAQGMLTAGIASRLLTDAVGVGAVRRYRTRFEDLVWPGDTVAVGGSVADERVEGETSLLEIEITARTGDGRRVLSGDATLAAERSTIG
jgi:acyl dehydratase